MTEKEIKKKLLNTSYRIKKLKNGQYKLMDVSKNICLIKGEYSLILDKLEGYFRGDYFSL